MATPTPTPSPLAVPRSRPDDSAPLLAHALWYGVTLGIPVLICLRRKKIPNAECCPNGLTDATTEEHRIRDWWGRFPDGNIGGRCGDRMAVLDLDWGSEEQLDLIEEEHGILRASILVQTPSGYYHRWYLPTTEDKKAKAGFMEGFDWRGSRSYVMLPPSYVVVPPDPKRPEGSPKHEGYEGFYAFAPGYAPVSAELGTEREDGSRPLVRMLPWVDKLTAVPDWLLSAIPTREGSPNERDAGWGGDIPDILEWARACYNPNHEATRGPAIVGNRNSALTAIMGYYRGTRGADFPRMLDAARHINFSRFETADGAADPLDDHEVIGIVRSVAKYPRGLPPKGKAEGEAVGVADLPGGAGTEETGRAPEPETEGSTPVSPRPKLTAEERLELSRIRNEGRAAAGAPLAGSGTSLDGHERHDVGNARWFAACLGDSLRWCGKHKSWFSWDGARWVADESEGERVKGLAFDVLGRMMATAAKIEDVNQRAAWAGHAAGSHAAPKIRAMIDMAKGVPGMSVSPNDFDAVPYLVNFTNGTLDLRTMELLPHRREDLLTQCMGAAYDSESVRRVWSTFLRRVIPDADTLRYLQKFAGAAIMGGVKPHQFVILMGGGRNGKSTFVETLAKVFGSYGVHMEPETLVATPERGGGARPDLARLQGVRAVWAAEWAPGARLNETLIKRLIGGDKIAVRDLFAKPFDLLPQCSLFITGNHLPDIKGTDLGIWRRVRLIDFPVTIAADEVDDDLPAKLEAEADGIARWLVEGYALFKAEGLPEPEGVKTATERYRVDSDPFTEFLSEHIEARPGARLWARDLYPRYVQWAKQGYRVQPWSQTALGREMERRGYRKEKDGTVFYHDIGLTALPPNQSYGDHTPYRDD